MHCVARCKMEFNSFRNKDVNQPDDHDDNVDFKDVEIDHNTEIPKNGNSKYFLHTTFLTYFA